MYIKCVIFQNVYQNVPGNIKAGLTSLWSREGAITDRLEIEKRLQEVIYIVKDEATGDVVGVSTASKRKVRALNNNFLYEFRCYLGQEHRIAGLDVKLSRLTFDFLAQLASEDPEKPIGIFAVLSNDVLKQHPVWRRAVWPELNMYFIGHNKLGDPIRVHYFKGARI
jgi:hypothetical protein